MTSLKLTTGPGNPCSGIGMEANGSTAVAEMRSTTEATNGLALDGLTVFGSVMRVNRPKDYTGPDTDPPKLDPNLLLQICTGSNAEKEYSEVVRVGRQLLETYREPEPEKDANVPSVVMTMPMVECSRITRRVPVSAARSKGTSSSNHGLLTMRGFSFSSWPMAPSTI